MNRLVSLILSLLFKMPTIRNFSIYVTRWVFTKFMENASYEKMRWISKLFAMK